MQSYNLFYKNAVICIRKFAKKTIISDDVILKKNISDYKKLINNFLKNVNNLTIACENQEEVTEAFEKIKKCFEFQKAAGGIVFLENKMLIINKFGKYDLPKGHVEQGETDAQTALREVEEETGVTHLNIVKDCTFSYHIFSQKNKFVLKQTHWFVMTTNVWQEPNAQTEEGIEQATWISKEDIDNFKANTYPSLLEVLTYL